jgi:hypothetical protein
MTLLLLSHGDKSVSIVYIIGRYTAIKMLREVHTVYCTYVGHRVKASGDIMKNAPIYLHTNK